MIWGCIYIYPYFWKHPYNEFGNVQALLLPSFGGMIGGSDWTGMSAPAKWFMWSNAKKQIRFLRHLVLIHTRIRTRFLQDNLDFLCEWCGRGTYHEYGFLKRKRSCWREGNMPSRSSEKYWWNLNLQRCLKSLSSWSYCSWYSILLFKVFHALQVVRLISAITFFESIDPWIYLNKMIWKRFTNRLFRWASFGENYYPPGDSSRDLLIP